MMTFSPDAEGQRPLPQLLLGFACLGLLSACQIKKSDDTSPQGRNASSAAIEPSQIRPPLTLAPLGRAAILRAVSAATDAAASGQPYPAANRELMDRTFELHLPFACDGTATGTWGDVEVDPIREVLRINVKPERWDAGSPVGMAAPDQIFDAIEGFWIERPWTMSDSCPKPIASATTNSATIASSSASMPAADEPKSIPENSQTVALAQFFAPETSRTLQRKNRPYTFTGKSLAGQSVSSGAYRLKLTGRIVGFIDGQPIHCTVADVSRAPLCVVAVEFIEVSIENGDADNILATWK